MEEFRYVQFNTKSARFLRLIYMSEHDEQSAFFDVLRLNERKHPELKWVFAIPNGGARSKAVAGKLKHEGVKSGVFDIFVPRFRYPNWHGLFIEMKFGRNKLTENQEEFQEFARSQGYATRVCYSTEEALEQIEKYLSIKLLK